jgi:hypothetical protein
MKTEAAEALWKLAKNNINTCKSIMESKAMLCIAILLEKGKGAMVVIREIFSCSRGVS